MTLTIDQVQSKENGNKMKKRTTKMNNTDPICTSINQEGAKMYIMTLRSLKSTKQMHFIYKIIVHSENGGHLEKIVALLDFQVALGHI